MPAGIEANKHTFSSSEFRGVVDEAINFFDSIPVYPLPLDTGFEGAGVYALYYIGEFELYTHIARANKDCCVKPIYVGKAVPPGWRTARALTLPVTRALSQRIREHTKTIEGVENLRIEDFCVRFMILQGVEIDLVVPVEAELIRRYTPLWNSLVDGFGNHDPGAGRYDQAKSEWDVLHPGRRWAQRLRGTSPKLQEIVSKIKQVKERLFFS